MWGTAGLWNNNCMLGALSGWIPFPFSTTTARAAGADAFCCTVREVTLKNKIKKGERQSLHLVPRFSASRQWMSLIPLLSEAESGWPALLEQ